MWDNGIREFLHYLRFEKKYSPHTRAAYQKDLEQFTDFIGREKRNALWPQWPHSSEIRAWMVELRESGIAPSSINRKLASLRAFFRFLQRENGDQVNPAESIYSVKTPKKLPVFLKEEEIRQLLQEPSGPETYKERLDLLILSLIYDTGLRREEVVRLQIKDLDWDRTQIRVWGKGNKERLIPVSEVQLDRIREFLALRVSPRHPDHRHRLFILESGTALYPQYVYRLVRDAITRVSPSEKRSPHVLRHSFATHLLQHGANIQAIKDLLGHSSLAATQIYTHNQIEQLKHIHKENHPRG